MPWQAIRFHFTAPLLLSRGGGELDGSEVIFHSDALRAALYAVGLPYFDDWREPDYFFKSFTCSSCFPFAGDEFFLPRPFLPADIRLVDVPNSMVSKKVKKIIYISKTLFEQYISGRGITTQKSCITADGLFLCEREEVATAGVFSYETQQRVQVPPWGHGDLTRPFFSERVHFHQGCGLYVIMNFSGPVIREQVLQALHILSATGIGSDRTVGNGFFSYNTQNDVSDFFINISQGHNRKLNLGLYLPAQEDLQHIDFNQSMWRLVKRGGYIAAAVNPTFSHLRKKSIWMFSEGSVFYTTGYLKGKYVDLRPDAFAGLLHPVWRDGICLFLEI